MLKLDTKGGIICTGILSIAFAITYLALMDNYFWRNGPYELGMHISALHILCSVCLLIGVYKHKYKLFVPWMISTGFFMYLMVYLGIFVLTNTGEWYFVPIMVVPRVRFVLRAKGFRQDAEGRATILFRSVQKGIYQSYIGFCACCPNKRL